MQKYTEIKESTNGENTDQDSHASKSDSTLNDDENKLCDTNIEGDDVVSKISKFQRLKGMMMILVAGILLLSTTTLAKYLKHIPVGEYLFFRFFFLLMFLLPIQFHQQPNVDMKGKFKLIFARAVLGAINAMCKFWAVVTLEYGNAIALVACAPIFAAFFSRVLWKEKINLFTVIALLLGMGGMTLIAKPEFLFGSTESDSNKSNAAFALVPIFGSVCLGLGFSLLRKIGKKPYILIVPLWQAIVTMPVSVVFHFGKRDTLVLPGCYTDRLFICAVGAVSVVALFLLNRGMAIEKSGPGALVRNVDMVLAYIIQVVIFDEPLDYMSVAGGGLIIFSTVVVATDKLFDFSGRYWLCEF